MNRTIARLILMAGCGAAFCGCKHMDAQQQVPAAWKIGAAEIDITAPVGHRMAGYFDERLATGTHDTLKAKAIVLDSGREKIAFVFCDLVGLSLHVTTNARPQASAATGIPIPNIMMCATHSHTGPLFDDTRRHYFHDLNMAKFGYDPTEKIYYPDFLTEKLVEVVTQANANLKPAELDFAIANQEGLSFNRRYYMKNGKVQFNPGQMNTNVVRPAGPIDPDVPFLLARDARSGKPFAGATIFAMHADCTSGSLYSADYPFGLQQQLREKFGTNFISAFGAGTCGDINQINPNKKEPFKGLGPAEHFGRTLGKTVLKNLPQMKQINQPSVAVRSETILAPLQVPTPAQIADAKSKIALLGDSAAAFMMKVEAVKTLDLEQKGLLWPMEVQVFRLDSDTAIVCLPCEIFVELGLSIKKQSPFKKTVVISICNDRPSYVPTKKAFTEGSYEVTNARVAPGVGETLVETAVKLLKEAAAK